MKNKTIIVTIAALIVGLLIGLTIDNFILTGEVTAEIDISKDYTYTTAICNSDNECIDVLVTCEQGKVTDLIPTTDLVQFGASWQDIREKADSFCK